MKKQEHQQLIATLETIEQAQKSSMYDVCQEGIEAMLNFIEDISEKTKTSALLEEHFELLYKASIGEIGKPLLKNHLSKIKNSIKHELKPTRLEIAFITHKASMSDSIESIYLAAKEDPDCDAFWIPVPYYEHNSKGEPEFMRFEGQEFYPNLPCTPWTEYDIEGRRPDVIFTFSLYDSFNRLSSIHPDFYCQRLRNLTDLLVSVPYYVDVDDGTADEYWLLPGFLLAHKTILANERTRSFHVNAYKKENDIRLGLPEEKFIALGSPKYDKAINTKREDCILPDKWNKWQNLIADKKVILYISSIGPMGETKETYFQKLEYILNTFHKRDDVVFWWRPHPLFEVTINSAMPGVLPLYKKIVELYKGQNWGIYDDTSDLHRAIAWSDGVYGDWSSVLMLCEATGKPAMMANTTTRTERLKPGLGDIRCEGADDTLEKFIDDVKSGSVKREAKFEGNAGERIYDYAKRVVLGGVRG